MAGRTLTDVMSTQRSVRLFSDEPVPDETVRRVMELTTRAPNGSNNQGWRFIVVRDAEQRRRLGQLYIESVQEQHDGEDLNAVLARSDLPPMLSGGLKMALNMPTKPPVMVLACFERQNSYDPAPSIYPAVQNLMLAAWDFGLGTILTTALHRRMDAGVREVLGIPSDIIIYAFVPMGYPARSYGPPKRGPVSEVAFFDRWGAKATWE